MTRDPVYASELAHDTAGVDAGPFMQAALDSIVEDIMAGEKVRGLAWGLHDFLAEQDDIAELAAAVIISGDFASFKDMIEAKLRVSLADADVTHDLAAQLAAEKPEEA